MVLNQLNDHDDTVVRRPQAPLSASHIYDTEAIEMHSRFLGGVQSTKSRRFRNSQWMHPTDRCNYAFL
jgi:hypothetical protein